MKSLEKAIYAGIGMALKGKDKAEKAAKKFVKDSQMEAKQGKAFVDKVVKESEKTKKEILKNLDSLVQTTVKKMGYISDREANAMKAEIAKLKAQVAKGKKAEKPKKAKAVKK